ncbi:PA14 domain-containing protein [Verrucomicrobia bacterium]|nr:PA14 domain-containing protein [Verrucomicrobiota bacterium]
MKLLPIALSLCCATPLTAADADAEPAAKPVPWHVQSAELRAPVTVEMKDALLRMPPQVYVADLKPLETTGGLGFNPRNKDAIQIDVRDPKEKAATIAKEKAKYKKAGKTWDPKAYGRLAEEEGGPMMRVNGSVTVALKPEYKFFTWRSRHGKVFIDGKLVKPERIRHRYWRRGEAYWHEREKRGTRQLGTESSHVGDPHNGLVAIPAGAMTLKLEVVPNWYHPHLRQAGFITRYPKVARATICIPGHDPSKLVPVVYRAGGERVGCRVVWAQADHAVPMTIMFDSSSGDEDYWVYLVDQTKAPAALDWMPQVELIQELRQLDRYNPEVETLAGFEKVWRSATIVGRGIPQKRVTGRITWQQEPKRVIYTGTPPFRRNGSEPLSLHELAGSQPATLCRLSGNFHIPTTGFYRIFCMSGPGGYVLLDGQLIASFRGSKSGRLFEIEIEKGQHRIDVLRYSPTGQVGWAGLWWKDPWRDINGDYATGWPLFGETKPLPFLKSLKPSYLLWEPLAGTMTAPLEHRSNGSWATFSWYQLARQRGVYPTIAYPKYALNWYRFSAHAPGASADAVYRWKFDDGSTAEGKKVSQLFVLPGIKKVQLEVLDSPGGKVIARAAGEVTVQMTVANWHKGNLYDSRLRPPFSPLADKIWAFAEKDGLERMPLDDLLNFYEWLNTTAGTGRGQNFYLDGDVWTNPSDNPALTEVFDKAVESYRYARRRSGDVLAARVDELIDGAYPYSELLRIAQSVTRSERRPTVAHYAAAEKLLNTVLKRAPAGCSLWRTAALALADIKLSVRGDAEASRALLDKFQHTEPSVDMLESWQFARARQYHHLADTDKLAPLTAGVDWSPIERPRHRVGFNDKNYQPIRGRTPEQAMSGYGWSIAFKDNRGFWLAREFDLPADWKGDHLVFEAGLPIRCNNEPIEHAWINGQPLGRMWQWLDERIVIPAKLLNKGGKNRITWLIQPYPWSASVQDPDPVLTPDLKYIACATKVVVMREDPKKKRPHGTLQRLGGDLMVAGAVQDKARSFAFSPDGKRLASGHQYGNLRLWDIKEALEPSHTISIGMAGIVSVAFSPDGKRLAAGGEDNRITLLDPIGGRVLRSFVAHESYVAALAFSPDGKRLASAAYDQKVKIWDSSSGKELLTITGHSGPVLDVAYSPDGKSIATAIDNKDIRLSDATTGRPLRTLEGEQGEVSSLAFSPDGKRLAAGYTEGLVSQWDLESGKRLTMNSEYAQTATNLTRTVTEVIYSPDGKELASIGGASAQKWDSETGSGGKQFAMVGQSYVARTHWLPPSKGPNRLADGFDNFPVGIYMTKDCQQQGMKYACYDVNWEKIPRFDSLELPDFESLKPVKQGVVRHIDSQHLNDVLPPYWKVTEQDGQEHRTGHPRSLIVTGYLKVKEAGDYTFWLQSADPGWLVVGSKTVIDNKAQGNPALAAKAKHGTVHLEPGVHPITLSYLNARDTRLNFAFPRAFVRSLLTSEIARSRMMGGVLLAQGKREQAKSLLSTLHRGGWPLSDEEQYDVEQVRIRIRRLARADSINDHSYALKLIESSLIALPMLRLDPEFMVSVIAVYARMGDPRAAILAEQMLEADMNDGQRRRLIMAQVTIKLNEDDLPAAGKVYRKLKELAPQSEETIEARELIKAAVIKKK